MSEHLKDKTERGWVTKITLDIEYPDGSSREITIPVEDDYGGILFKNNTIESILGALVVSGISNASQGLQTWHSPELPWKQKPTYLILHDTVIHGQNVLSGSQRECWYPG